MKIQNSLSFVKGIVLSVGAFLLWIPISRLPEASAILPKTATIAILVGGLLLIVSSFTTAAGQKSPEGGLDAATKIRVATLAVLMFVGWAFLPVLGFYSTLAIVAVAGSLVFIQQHTKRRMVAVAVYSILLTGTLFVVFRIFLGFPAPRGVLF